MLRTLAVTCLSAQALALKLQTEAVYDLTSKPYNTDAQFVYDTIMKQEQFTDKDFPANADSIGKVDDIDAKATKWMRAGEIFPPSKLHMFSNSSPYSTMVQGYIGDCYYLSTLVALDARPGALENMFVTKDVNKAGIYAMTFYIAGEKVVVHIDDQFPTSFNTLYGRSGNFPVFAKSHIEGELWPLVAEKCWAKLVGTYGYIVAGQNTWVLMHLTNDPSQSVTMEPNMPKEKADNIWKKMRSWSDKEYMMFVGSTKTTDVIGPEHAYTLLQAEDLVIKNKPVRIVKLRNPWGEQAYKGAYSQNSPEYKDLEAYFESKGKRIEKEKGKYFIPYETMIKQLNGFDVGYTSERTTKDNQPKPEWRPFVRDIDGTGSVAIKVTLCDDIDLVKDFFGVQMYLGGNLVSVDRQKDYKKPAEVGYFDFNMQTVASKSAYKAKWQTFGAFPDSFDLENIHVQENFGEKDKPTKMTKGTYLLNLNPKWAKGQTIDPMLKKLTVGFSSPVPLVTELITKGDATSRATAGQVKMVKKDKACNGDVKLSKGLTLLEAANEAKAKNCDFFVHDAWDSSWCCSATEEYFDWKDYNTFQSVAASSTDSVSAVCKNAPDASSNKGIELPGDVPAYVVPSVDPVTPVDPVVDPVDPNTKCGVNSGRKWNGTACVCPSGTALNPSNVCKTTADPNTDPVVKPVDPVVKPTDPVDPKTKCGVTSGQVWTGTVCVCPSGTTLDSTGVCKAVVDPNVDPVDPNTDPNVTPTLPWDQQVLAEATKALGAEPMGKWKIWNDKYLQDWKSNGMTYYIESMENTSDEVTLSIQWDVKRMFPVWPEADEQGKLKKTLKKGEKVTLIGMYNDQVNFWGPAGSNYDWMNYSYHW